MRWGKIRIKTSAFVRYLQKKNLILFVFYFLIKPITTKDFISSDSVSTAQVLQETAERSSPFWDLMQNKR